jgi:maltose alpha-D-glucosyltransferase / alpha-amylase
VITDVERDRMNDIYAGDKPMRLNLGMRRRLAPLLDRAQWSENSNRADGGWNARFSSADPAKLYAPLIQDPVYGHAAVSVLSQTNHSVPNGTGRITAVRKMTPGLGSGSIGSLSSQLQGYWPTCESWGMTRSWWLVIF